MLMAKRAQRNRNKGACAHVLAAETSASTQGAQGVRSAPGVPCMTGVRCMTGERSAPGVRCMTGVRFTPGVKYATFAYMYHTHAVQPLWVACQVCIVGQVRVATTRGGAKCTHPTRTPRAVSRESRH
jgi:hypothetical protein